MTIMTYSAKLITHKTVHTSVHEAHNQAAGLISDLMIQPFFLNWSFLWWCLEINYFYESCCLLMGAALLCFTSIRQPKRRPWHNCQPDWLRLQMSKGWASHLSAFYYSFLLVNFDSKLDKRITKAAKKIPNSGGGLRRINVSERAGKRAALHTQAKRMW